jgi:hypothetical protein
MAISLSRYGRIMVAGAPTGKCRSERQLSVVVLGSLSLSAQGEFLEETVKAVTTYY